MPVSVIFLLVALIISIGFLGRWLFRVTRIPDSMLLIAAGFGLKALLGMESGIFQKAAPYFGAFALLVILFEGGLHLEFAHLVKSWKRSLTLMSIVFLLSFGLVAAFSLFVFERALINSLVLGAALACTSAAIVVPLIREVKVSKSLQTILQLESSLSDAIAVLVAVTLLGIATSENGSSQIGMLIFSSLTGSLFIGILAGFVWTWLLGKHLAGQQLTYLMTFAVMLLVYAGCEAVHSSGVFGVFLFGLAYSNGPHIFRSFWPKTQKEDEAWDVNDTDIKGFHAEITFLVRTFFFVFLGLIFDPLSITVNVLYEAAGIYVLIVLARWIAVWMVRGKGDAMKRRHEFKVLFLFMPRGLASAVLATLPLQYGLTGTADFISITVLIILLTNLAITFGVRHIESTAPEISD